MPSERTARRRLLRTAGTALVAAQAGCVSSVTNAGERSGEPSCSTTSQPFSDEWPLPGYDRQNTSANPQSSGPTGSIGVKWTDGGHGFVRTTPVVADDTVFLHAHPNRLHAFSHGTGEKQWTFEMGAQPGTNTEVSYPRALSAPAVVGDTVYVGGGNSVLDDEGNRTENHAYLYAIDRRDGDVRWKFQPDDYVHTAPVVVGDLVMFATRTGTVYAVEQGSDSVAWTFSPDGNPGPVVSTPAVDDCRLYLDTPDAGLYAIDGQDGTLVWHDSDVRSWAAPAVTNGRVYAATRDGRLVAVDADDGAVEWEYETGGNIATAGPAVSDGVAFVGNVAGDSGIEAPRIHAVDMETGNSIWTADTQEYVKSSPAVADEAVYVAAGPNVLGLDATTGEQMWAHETRGWTSAPLSVADGTVFGATANGQLYVLAEPDSS